MSKIPLDHLRRPAPPWRPEGVGWTECGRSLDDVRSVVSVEHLQAKYRSQGQQRAALTTCMTCVDTSNRYARSNWAYGMKALEPVTFDSNPCAVIARDAQGQVGKAKGHDTLEAELRAIALLIEAHPDEFAETLTSLGTVETLDALRAAKQQRPTRRAGIEIPPHRPSS